MLNEKDKKFLNWLQESEKDLEYWNSVKTDPVKVAVHKALIDYLNAGYSFFNLPWFDFVNNKGGI